MEIFVIYILKTYLFKKFRHTAKEQFSKYLKEIICQIYKDVYTKIFNVVYNSDKTRNNLNEY